MRLRPRDRIQREAKPRRSTSLPNLRVVLDRSFVANYLRQQGKEQPQNISTISLNSNSSDDADKSVQFVNEEPATCEIKQIAKMNQQMAKLQLRCKKLELHVGALQNHVIDQQNIETIQSEAANADNVVDATHEAQVIENAEAIDLSADLQLSESFIDNQLSEWKENGVLAQVFDEFQVFLNENH